MSEEIRKDPKSSVILAFTGVVASGGLFYVGLKLTTASNAGILSATTPIWVTVLSWLFLGERLKLVNVTGVGLSCVGLVTIICQGSVANLLQRSLNWGDVLIMVGQLNWAVYTIYSRVALATRSPTATTASAYLVGAVALLPAFFLEEPFPREFDFNPMIIGAVCYLSVLSPLANLLYYQALTRRSPHRAAVFMNLTPVIVLTFSALFLGEQITTVQLLGTGLVIGGVVLTTWR
jgi:drug/metabolite transporter (DMT)-like permease